MMLALVTLKVETVSCFQAVCVCKIVGIPWHWYQMSFCAEKGVYTSTDACAKECIGDEVVSLSI